MQFLQQILCRERENEKEIEDWNERDEGIDGKRGKEREREKEKDIRETNSRLQRQRPMGREKEYI